MVGVLHYILRICLYTAIDTTIDKTACRFNDTWYLWFWPMRIDRFNRQLNVLHFASVRDRRQFHNRMQWYFQIG